MEKQINEKKPWFRQPDTQHSKNNLSSRILYVS